MASSLSSPLIPDVRDIGAELQAIVVSGEAVVEIATTLQRIALGFMLAFVLAIAVGLASARNRVARAFFEPALILTRWGEGYILRGEDDPPTPLPPQKKEK